ncbi:hypothetical protein B0T20DRAFT_44748 [Sordaria brevicollis]|uniref:Uncharacterized protein n=1 Tax=Sordaria brevicollis TaxID=83679 RepID=A0AAE0P9Q0_SORBR|nr:hypothetical protein B0T20DRAFT_44748 [Sordaria brevicollis]
MRPRPLLSLFAGFGLVASTAATTIPVFSAVEMSNSLADNGTDLALAGAPMWFFGRTQDHPPCYPTAAVNDKGEQTPPAELCEFPDTGCNCRYPWISNAQLNPSFPVYYSFQECRSGEVQVAYNLFYEKDGFSPEGVFGHAYDWEHVIVVWKNTTSSDKGDSTWSPTRLLLSAHGKMTSHKWDDFVKDKNTDKPKVYVSWGKHAQYAKPTDDEHNETTLLREMTEDAYRAENWWYDPKKEDLIRADRSTKIGKLIESFNWGKAYRNPVRVYERLCTNLTAEH